jgi:hypothetical protein
VATVIALQSFVGRLKKDERGTPPKDKAGNAIGQPPVTKAGEKIDVVMGQLFDSNHPAVKAFPKMFGQQDAIGRSVEQATAAPGEKR